MRQRQMMRGDIATGGRKRHISHLRSDQYLKLSMVMRQPVCLGEVK
jgi:hypothetical protein